MLNGLNVFGGRVKLDASGFFGSFSAMSRGIRKSSFGRLPDGPEIDLYTLTNANGLSVKIMNYGATLVEIQTPDRHGKFANIILGYETLEEYVNGKDYRGAIIGRVANRIAGASFTLDGKTYQLAANDGPNHLHGGIRGFDKRVWQAKSGESGNDSSLWMSYTSEDGEEGYPGNLEATVRYSLTEDNTLLYTLTGKSDKPTPVNLTSHPYWNLAGEGDILQHELTVTSDRYTPMDAQHLPTGKIAPVDGTPFDFRKSAPIGSRIKDLPGSLPGYNLNYVLNKQRPAAVAREPKSGRVIELETTEPGLQFYSGTFLKKPYTGFCLETQNYPDAVHHDHFPSILSNPGQDYFHTALVRFYTD